MILRDKMFIVSALVDDSIKSHTSVYDITLFKSFLDFERYIDQTPVVLDTILLTTDELPFTATNMSRLLKLLGSPFLTVKGNIIYLIDKTYDYKVVNDFCIKNKLENWAVYQDNLTMKFLAEIVSGEGRESVEGQNEIVTYRMRQSEYIREQNRKRYENDDAHYETDEDVLAFLPNEEEPENIMPEVDFDTEINYIVGEGIEPTLFGFLVAQYLSLDGKTVIVERDWEYHTLSDLALKSGIDCEFFDIKALMEDFTGVLMRIKGTQKRLIVIGSKDRFEYDYSFVMDLLESNLNKEVKHIIRECTYAEAPYGRKYTVVVSNTLPAVLKGCNSLKYDITPEDVTFVGLQLNDLGPVNITGKELVAVVSMVLGKNAVAGQVVRVNGILLKGEDVIYDILSILNRGNRR